MIVGLACGVVALAWGPAGALAGGDPSRDVPAVSQYVEVIPESEGSAPLDGDSGLPKPDAAGDTDEPAERPVSAPVAARIAKEGGTDAEFLGEIATPAASGAPARLDATPAAAAQVDTGRAYGDRRMLLLGALLAPT